MSKYVQLPTGAVTDTTQAVGVVTITTGGGGGGAPTNASYLVLGTNATLTNERVLTAGTGITLTDGGAGGNLTIASSGGGNTATAIVDFGTGTGDYSTSTVVTGQTWVTSSSKILTSVIDYGGENTAEEASVEGLTITIGDIVAGTGFTVYAASPFGSVGKYQIACMGV